MSAFETQVSGNHYSKLAIQPMQYSMANKLDACQHTIIKYVTRFRDKNGRIDLEKAKHVIDMLIELEYGDSSKPAESDDGWIEWNGGECLLNKTDCVEYKIKGASFVQKKQAGKLDWNHYDMASDIVAYRVVKD